MIKVIECKTCGHLGDKQNPLCIQGLYRIPYCCNCMNEACKKAAENLVIKEYRELATKKK